MFTHYVNRWRLFESFFEKGEFSCELNWSDSLTRELFLFVDAEDIEKSSFGASIFPTTQDEDIKPVHITLADISLACQTSDSLLTLNRFSCSEKIEADTQPHSHRYMSRRFSLLFGPSFWGGDWHWSFEDWGFAGIVPADRHFMDVSPIFATPKKKL